MPGRTSVRASRKAAATAVEDSPPAKTTTKSRTTSSRTTTAPAVLQATQESEATTLRNRICSVFADAQRSNSTQRKLAVTLRKIQEACCYEEDKPSKRVFGDEEYDESDFNEEVGRCVLRVLGIKKSEGVGDRLIRFLGVFLRLAGERDAAIFRADDPDNEDGFPETPTSRLTTHILSIALQVIAAKDKGIRYRATQIVAHIINTLDSIDDEVFQLVRLALLKRLRDKESNVRVQAVLGLGRLADEGEEQDEDENSDDDDVAGGILRKLQDTLQHDPSADVRKALLLNLPFTPGTLPYLLERARDLDAATRRALYSRLLPALGDFRHLSLTHREKLLRWGLRDRDETVRKATARLFRERWIEDCARPQAQPEGEDGEIQTPTAGPQQAAEPSMDALLELLERIDILNAGVETGIAHEAMAEFWAGRPDYLDYMTFEDPYFTDNLTPESSFIARSFNEYCRTDAKLAAQAEDKMPEVTKFAFILQQHLVKLIELVQEVALNPDDVDNEEDAVQQEFCVEQLLHISLTLDYSDEMGRRKMFSVLREALAIAELPEECTKLVIECLRVVCGKTTNMAAETEFCSVVLEAVAEVHDTIMGDSPSVVGDESFHSARSEVDGDATPTKTASKKQSVEAQEMDDEEKAVREIMVNMKCLHIAQCMLQNVQSDLEKSSHLVTMLNSLVVPAVRSQEAPVRERGLICLGLCCLLAKNLAEENLMLFIHCFTRGHPALQVIAIQIITDILIAHPSLLVEPASGSETPSPNQFTKPIQKIYLKALRSSEEPQVQSTSATALSKLLLAGIFRSDSKDDTDLLKQMVLSYFHPETAGNPSLRQSMTYFLPVYCHTRTRNAVVMANIAIPVLRSLVEIMEDLVDDGVDQDMVGLSSVAAQICDWTDPRKAYNADQALPILTSPRRATGVDDLDGHVVLASELLDKILTPGCSKEDRKLFISMLGKLHIDPDKTSVAALQHLVERVGEAVNSKVAAEVSSRNTLSKLHTTLSKALATAIEGHEDEATTTVDTRSQSRDTPIDTTEVADTTTADTTTASVDDETLIQAQLAAEAGAAVEHSTLDSPVTSETESTMLTRFTGAPDAEGTVFGDFDDNDEDEEDEDDSTEVGVSRPVGKVSIPIRGSRPSAGAEESLLDSLLEDESDDGIE